MILVVQFREDFTREHEQQCIKARMPQGEPIRFCSIFDNVDLFNNPQQLLQGVDKLILGGSAGLSMGAGHENNDYTKVDFILHTIEPLIRYVLEQDFPTLGTCFGHHLIGHFAGSLVAYDSNMAETGAFEVTLTPNGTHDRLFRDVPETFFAIEGHQDSLVSLPHGATLLARSERCEYQALRYGNNIYTTQFHSELDEHDLEYRLSFFPEYRSHVIGESMHLPPSPYSVAPLQNFFRM